MSDAASALLVPGAYAGFFAEMQELGLVSGLEDSLPDGFSAVFEIGRILADPKDPIARSVGRALELDAPLGIPLPAKEARPSESLVEVPAAEEYEAEFIRSWSDVPYVYSWQHLLPEEEFLRRLANRTLWFPSAKAPLIRSVLSGDDDFSPSPSKQKVYVLLDTSASMALHHRFALAKAAVLRFLRANRRDLGEVQFRTFDVDVGPLEEASDLAAYDALLRRVARQVTLGNGTCLERAILIACEDIRQRRSLAGSEILIVTDGAARLEEGKVREALGADIRMHCVKIGSAQVFATDAYVQETLEHSRATATRRDQRIQHVRERREKILEALKRPLDDVTKDGLRQGLRECEADRRALAEDLRRDYGHEIERLCEVFVEVPDLDGATVFRLDRERLASLEALVAAAMARLDEVPASAEALKEAALLLAHLTLLASEQTDAGVREVLDLLREKVASRLERSIDAHEARVLDSGLLSPADQRDLRMLLGRGAERYSSLWLALLRYFYTAFAKLRHRS